MHLDITYGYESRKVKTTYILERREYFVTVLELNLVIKSRREVYWYFQVCSRH